MAKKYGTDEQNNAFNAGVGYGYGKMKKRVDVKPENQAAFRDGVNAARSKLGKPTKTATTHTRAETIDYYSKRVGDESLTKGQRKWAAKRLKDLAKG